MSVHHVHPAIASDIFAELRAEFDKAVEHHGFLDAEDLETLVSVGRLGMLVAIVDDEIKGAAVYEIMVFPKRKTINVVSLVGKKGTFSRWSAEIVEELVKLCETYGCSHLTSEGRIGWLSVARKLGFRTVKRACLVKEITVHEQGRKRDAERHHVGTVGAFAGASTATH